MICWYRTRLPFAPYVASAADFDAALQRAADLTGDYFHRLDTEPEHADAAIDRDGVLWVAIDRVELGRDPVEVSSVVYRHATPLVDERSARS